MTTLLASLSDKQGLQGDARYEHAHRTYVNLLHASISQLLTVCYSISDHPSRTTLVLFRYPQSDSNTVGVGHNKHTDIGSLTLLFSEQWGLQVLSPSENKWRFIAPKPGHAIINVGDSLRFLSGKKFWSCVHRVVPTAETQLEHRYSIAYFLRAEDDAQYVDSHGGIVKAKEWHDGKYEVFRQGHEEQERDSVLTGGMEKGEAIAVT